MNMSSPETNPEMLDVDDARGLLNLEFLVNVGVRTKQRVKQNSLYFEGIDRFVCFFTFCFVSYIRTVRISS
jgi:hypothetical protein